MAYKHIVPEWLRRRRGERGTVGSPGVTSADNGGHQYVTQDIMGSPVTYNTSRAHNDDRETGLLRDVAFNNHAMNDGEHISPFDNGQVRVGDDHIKVELVQGIDEASFKRVLGMATRATIGVNLDETTVDEETAGDDWQEMMRGGLQTALEDAVIVFAVSGVSRTCTHQIVRSRRAAFHQQSQRASYYGDFPEARMPESVWRNMPARQAWMAAKAASDQAYRIACEAGVSYQDARYVLLEGTDNYIMCEYSVREFLAVFDYRGCSMFSWEIVSVMRKMRKALLEAHPWLEPYVKISCEKTPASVVEVKEPRPEDDGVIVVEHFEHKCTFQGWESVEGQCPFSWAVERNRTFQPKLHKIASRAEQVRADQEMIKAGGTHKQTLREVLDEGIEKGLITQDKSDEVHRFIAQHETHKQSSTPLADAAAKAGLPTLQSGTSRGDAWARRMIELAGNFDRRPVNDAKVASTVEWLANKHDYFISPHLVIQLLQAYGFKRLKASMSLNVNPLDLVCATCGRDNRNGTHAALEGMHLNHKFDGITPEEYLARQG